MGCWLVLVESCESSFLPVQTLGSLLFELLCQIPALNAHLSIAAGLLFYYCLHLWCTCGLNRTWKFYLLFQTERKVTNCLFKTEEKGEMVLGFCPAPTALPGWRHTHTLFLVLPSLSPCMWERRPEAGQCRNLCRCQLLLEHCQSRNQSGAQDETKLDMRHSQGRDKLHYC